MADNTYDQWYLHNITNTAQVQRTNTVSSSKRAPAQNATNTVETAGIKSKIADRLTLSDAAKQQLDVLNSASSDNRNASGEDVPDFRAISLIKNSKIDFVVPKISSQAAVVDDLEVAKVTKQDDFMAAVKASEITISTPKANPQAKEDDTVSSAQMEDNSSLKVAEPPQKSKIKLLSKSDIFQKASLRSSSTTTAVASSSETSTEIESKQTAAKITPYEEKSFETYQNVIAYTNPLNVSNALAQAV